MTAFTHILCPVDFSEFSRRALRYAAWTARWYGARLTVLHVFPDIPVANVIPSLAMAGSAEAINRGEGRVRVNELMERWAAEIVPAGVTADLLVRDERNAAAEIANDAGVLHADLVVMGSHGRTGYERLLLGSIAERVVRTAPCPVIVVPSHATGEVPPGDQHFDTVLCAVDFSEASLEAVTAAAELAEDVDARLTLLTVIDGDGGRDPGLPANDLEGALAADTAARRRHLDQLVPHSARGYCRIETMVGHGRPAQEIVRVASESGSDLVVMGVAPRHALSRLVFGSTTHEVLQGAACPVLLLHRV